MGGADHLHLIIHARLLARAPLRLHLPTRPTPDRYIRNPGASEQVPTAPRIDRPNRGAIWPRRRSVVELVFEAKAGAGGLGWGGARCRIGAVADRPHRLEPLAMSISTLAWLLLPPGALLGADIDARAT